VLLVSKFHFAQFFLIGTQDKFLTNFSVHSINTRNKHHLHKPIANLSCFQKGASYSGLRIFSNLQRNITNFRNEKLQFKVALKNFYMHNPFTLWMNILHAQMICNTGLHGCVIPYIVIILYVLYAFDMFHILMSGDSLRVLWNVYICL